MKKYRSIAAIPNKRLMRKQRLFQKKKQKSLKRVRWPEPVRGVQLTNQKDCLVVLDPLAGLAKRPKRRRGGFRQAWAALLEMMIVTMAPVIAARVLGEGELKRELAKRKKAAILIHHSAKAKSAKSGKSSETNTKRPPKRPGRHG